MSTRFEYPDMKNNAGKFLRVNSTETNGEWEVVTPGGGGGPSILVYNIPTTITVNTAGRSVFLGLLGGGSSSVTEASARTPFYNNVTVERVSFYVNANTVNEGTTAILRKNGVDTAFSIVVPAGTTGLFDFVCNEAFSSTDEFSLNFRISGTATGSINIKTDNSQGSNAVNVLAKVTGSPATTYDTRNYQSSLSGTQASTTIIDGDKLVGSFYIIDEDDLDGLEFYDAVNVKRIYVSAYMNLPLGAPVANEDIGVYIYKNGVPTTFSQTITLIGVAAGTTPPNTRVLLEPNIAFNANDKYSFRSDLVKIIRISASVITGTFTPGETVTQASSGVSAEFVAQGSQYIVVRDATGIFDFGANPIIGATSGASATNPSSTTHSPITLQYYTTVELI